MFKIFQNILVCMLAFFVLLISIGFNISKLNCHQETSLYLGNVNDQCHVEDKSFNNSSVNTVSCCILELEKSCCTSFSDMCEKELSNLKFSFQTLLLEKVDFKLNSNFVHFFSFLPKKEIILSSFRLVYDIHISLIYKPTLSKIQSFII